MKLNTEKPELLHVTLSKQYLKKNSVGGSYLPDPKKSQTHLSSGKPGTQRGPVPWQGVTVRLLLVSRALGEDQGIWLHTLWWALLANLEANMLRITNKGRGIRRQRARLHSILSWAAWW